ncbi:outer membrane protein assembly factor BamB [Natronospira proteinivora]|uniref:Outer membrane protein assembly factor BamB n=1 Tax=Natronospira proteinivora TaxID=1807133 RepID=A0ABT1G7Q9_9GAMM|nr:outer membrane protein assembly factor BamB [Natronospira proteinivora]MCP1727325.1 outer membrane protein assembly factor BamB [Natronospira proteinivora]
MFQYRAPKMGFAHLLLLAAFLLAACAQPDAIEDPRELERFEARYDVDTAWSTRARGRAERLYLGLRPTFDGERVYTAGHAGRLTARNPENGRRIWRMDLDAPLAGGPAVGQGMVLVGALDGRLFALDADDGELLWSTQVGGEILTAPAISRGYIVVKTSDGHVRGLSADDGGEVWSRSEDVPSLQMRGGVDPIIRGSRVIVGFANGQVRAFGVRDGESQWAQSVGIAAGRNELEQIADIAPVMGASDSVVYAASASDRMAAISLSGGQRWQRDLGSLSGLAMDEEMIYLTDRHSEVHALNRNGGASVWVQDALRARQMTAPVVFGDTIVVGDLDGYLHFLDADSGDLVARERVSRKRINTAPVVAGDKLLVQDGDGRVRAYRLSER